MALPAIGLALLLATPAAASSPVTAVPPELTVTATEGATTRLVLRLRSPDGADIEGVEVRAEASFGSLGAVAETAPGVHEVLLSVPPTDMPRVVVVAFSPQDREDLAVGFALVPVTVSSTLTARTEARSRVTCRVGEREFGPVTALRDGTFSLDILLPPGAREAEVRIADSAANVTRQVLAVPTRRHDPLMTTVDRYRLTTDGRSRSRIHALAFDSAGRPIPNARIEGSADVGTLSSFRDRGDGVHVADFEPPADARSGLARVAIRLRRGDVVHEEIERVSLAPGAAQSLELAADPSELVAGVDREVALVATARDAAGNVLDVRGVSFHAERGKVGEAQPRDDGRVASTLAVPTAVESGTIAVKALLTVGDPSPDPARIDLKATPDELPTSWRAFSLITANVTDSEGQPVAGEVLLFQLARGNGRITPVAVTDERGLAFADFSADQAEEVATIEVQSTTRPSLRASVSVDKKSSGTFAVVDRPAVAARGGSLNESVSVGDGDRVLSASVLLKLAPGAPARLLASADPDELPADPSFATRVDASVLDAHGNLVADARLAFSVDRGSVSSVSETGDGRWQASVTAPEGAGDGSMTVVVGVLDDDLSARVPVRLLPGQPTRLALAADRDRMTADGLSRARLTATVLDATDVPVPGVEVELDVSRGDAIVESPRTTGPAGLATSGLTAGLEPGEVEVRARIVEHGLSASARLELVSVGPDDLVAEADPTRIEADGVERSEISVRLEDAFGNPMAGERVDFLLSGPGRLVADLAWTDTLGEARTWISSEDPGIARIRVRSRTYPSISGEVEVVMEASEIAADFAIDSPACEGEVRLTALVPEAVEWEWDWTDDGVADALGADPVALLSPGTWRVRLVVRDADGREGFTARDVVVHARPEAIPRAEPALVVSGGSIRLDASASFAADGGELAFAWDLDGDGEHDDATGPVVEAWTPAGDGLQVARVRVTGSSGCSDVAEVSVVVGEVPDVHVEVSVVDDSTVPAGSVVTWRVDWGNEGSYGATAARLESRLGAGLALVDAPPGAIVLAPGHLRWELGALAPGVSGSFDVTTRVTSELPAPTVTIEHAVTIGAAEADADPSDDADAASITAYDRLDASVMLLPDSPAQRAAGEALALVARVDVDADFAVPDATLTVTWDPDLLEDFASGLSSLASVNGQAVIDLGTLPARGRVDVPLGWRVAPTLPLPSQQASVRVQLAHAGHDPDPDDDEDRVSVTLGAAVDGWVELRAEPASTPLVPGSVVRFFIEHGNRGTTAVNAADLVLSFTPGVVTGLVDNPQGGVLAGDELSFVGLGTILPGGTTTLTASVRLASTMPLATTSLEAEAVFGFAEVALDTTPLDLVDRVALPVVAPPDVWVRLSGPTSAAAGDVVDWQLTVGNSGLRPAAGVVVEQVLDGAVLAHVGASRTGELVSTDPLVLRWSLGTIEPGRPVSWSHQVAVATPQSVADPIATTTASLTTSEPDDADPSNDAAGPLALPVRSKPDVAVALELSAATFDVGQSVDATITLVAEGDAPCAGGTVELDWTTGVFDAEPPVSFALPPLAVGEDAQLAPFTLRALTQQAAGTNLAVVTARASCPLDDDPSDDVDAESLTVRAAPAIQVEVVAPPTPIAAGTTGVVEVRWLNDGTTAASDVVIELASLDPALLVVLDGPMNVPSLGVGEQGNGTLVVRAAATLSAQSMTARVRATATPASAAAASDEADVPLAGSPDLAVTGLVARPTPSPAVAGGRVEYDLTIRNVGTAPSGGAIVTLARDPDLLIATSSLPSGGSDSGGVMSWPLPDLAPGAPYSRTVRFRLPDSFADEETEVVLEATADDPGDTSAENDSDSASFPVVVGVDLRVELQLEELSSPLRAGGSAAGRVWIGNAGSKDATDVVVTVRLDPLEHRGAEPLVQAVTAASDGGLVTANAVRWTIASLPAGTVGLVRDFVFELRPTLPAASNELWAIAEVEAEPVANPESNLADNTHEDSLVAIAAADPCVTLVATADPLPAQLGRELTYTVTVENRGTTASDPMDVDLVLDLAQLTITDPDGGLLTPGGVAWTGLVLGPGEARTWTVTTTLPNALPGLWYEMEAHAVVSTLQDDGRGCSMETPPTYVFVSTVSDLAVTKTLLGTSADPDPPGRGTDYRYRVEVVNLGGASSPGAILEDEYPPEMTVVDADGGTDAGGRLTWTLSGLGPGVSVAREYTLRVRTDLDTGLHVLRNTARVTNLGQDARTGNDSFSFESTLRLSVDLVLTLTGTASPAPATPGSRIDYVVEIRNLGSETATSPLLEVDLGPFAVLDSAPAGAIGTNPFTLGLSDIAPGEPRAVAFSARSLTVLPESSNDVTVAASVTSVEADLVPDDNVDSVTQVVRAKLDLVTELVGSDRDGAPLEAGDIVDFTLTLRNAGSWIATDVELVVSLHEAGPHFRVEDPGLFTPVGVDSLEHVLATPVALGSPVTLTFSLRVDDPLPAATSSLQACAEAVPSPFQVDEFLGNNRACRSFVASACPDLAIVAFTLTPPTNPAMPGQVLAGRLEVENRGSTGATSVVVTAGRDPATTGPASGAGVTDTGSSFTLDLGAVAAGQVVSADFSLPLATEMPALDHTVESRACAGAAEDLCNVMASCAEASVDVRAVVDAWVSLEVVPTGAAEPGQDLTARLDFGNLGSAPVETALLTLEVSEHLAVLDGGGGNLAGRTLTFALGTLGPGATGARTILLRVASVLPDVDNLLPLVASVTHDRAADDADAGNDTDSVGVTARAEADLWVQLERTSSAPAPDSSLSYRATWGNRGSTAARDATLRVGDDADLLLLTGQPPSELGKTFTLGTAGVVEPGASGAQALHYRVKPVLPAESNTLRTAVTVATTTADRTAADDTAFVEDVVTAKADLGVTLELATASMPAAPCEGLTATLTWRNAGGTQALDATATLAYDAALVTVTDPGGGVDDGTGTITWSIGRLDATLSGGATARLAIACVLPAASNALPFEARVSSATTEADPSDDVASGQIVVEACADLVAEILSVTTDPDPAKAGGNVSVEIALRNDGNTHADDVTLTGSWSDASAVEAVIDPSPGATPAGDDGLAWTLPRVDAQAGSSVRSFTLRLGATFPSYENVLGLVASASALTCDLDASSNQDADSVTIFAPPDLTLSTSVRNERTGTAPTIADPARPFDMLRYDHVVANVGAGPAESVRIASAFDDAVLDFVGGGAGVSAGAGTVLHERGAAALAPTASWSTWSRLSVGDAAVPPVRRDVDRTALADETTFALTRDANPGDNGSSTPGVACYLRATITPLYNGALCLGASVTLRADPVPEGSWTYEWSAPAGTLSAPTGRFTTFTPPEAAGTHAVRLVLRDPASGCWTERVHEVVVDGTCTSCGCQSAKPNVQYDGWFERIDQPGSRTVSPAEQVAFRVRLKETANARSAMLLGGPGNTSLRFSGGGATYEAWLPADVYLECQSQGSVEFALAEVPAGMPAGQYSLSFEWVTDDACDEINRRTDGSGGDRVSVVLPATNGAGVEFTDWGPQSAGDGGGP